MKQKTKTLIKEELDLTCNVLLELKKCDIWFPGDTTTKRGVLYNWLKDKISTLGDVFLLEEVPNDQIVVQLLGNLYKSLNTELSPHELVIGSGIGNKEILQKISKTHTLDSGGYDIFLRKSKKTYFGDESETDKQISSNLQSILDVDTSGF